MSSLPRNCHYSLYGTWKGDRLTCAVLCASSFQCMNYARAQMQMNNACVLSCATGRCVHVRGALDIAVESRELIKAK